MTTPALWVVALALWAGCLHPRGGGALAAAGACAVTLALAPALRGRGGPALALAAAGLVLAGAGLAGAREAAAAGAHLARLAPARAFVTVHARALDDARRTAGGSWQLLRVDAVDGRTVRERVLVRWPGSARPPRLGETVEASGTLRPLGRDGFAASVRLRHAVAELRVADHRLLARAPWHWRAAESLRARAARVFEAGLPDGHAALLLGLTLGVPPPAELAAPFDAAGLTHLLVVSGQHAVLTVLAVSALAARAGCGFRARRIAALAALAWLVLLVRPQPAVLRAAGAVTAAVGAQLLGRPGVALHVLGAVTLALLLADPFLARQTGFL
ncbi:MAG TPA: ComEC/Rec2 family competence protein, partial [Egibacteraceae bacterium]|nr:ComEC/Rec2 family competence protein [Egibacteraceae bacterium]